MKSTSGKFAPRPFPLLSALANLLFLPFGKRRYILDVDGNAWSARFKRLLSTGSLILKSTIFPEFWNDRIQPWLHCS